MDYGPKKPLATYWPQHTLAALCLCVVQMPVTAQTTGSAANLTKDVFRPLDVTVNGAKAGDWVLLERTGVLYAPQAAFAEWRVSLRPTAQSIDIKGQPYFALSSVPGYEAKIDFSTQSLALTFSPETFALTLKQEESLARPKLDPVLPSAFLNYDVNYSASQFAGTPNAYNLGALVELGISNNAGLLTSSAAGRNLIRNGGDNASPSWVRLETTFTRDFADINATLRLGDSITRGSLLGRNVYFGGVQYGTNFALTPGFISQPLPTISGLSAAPSTVELYVNNVLRQTTNVPTGPFTLTNLPTFNGGGEARLVVRDLLGRETVVTQPFFSSAQLLAPGLQDWSVEAGALRRDLGIVNAAYGAGFASGTYKRGLNSELTLEGRAELSRDLQTLSAGVIGVLPGQLLGRAALMTSRTAAQGSGNQWLLGAEYSQNQVNIGLQIQSASIHFRQLGLDSLSQPVRLQVAGNIGYFTDSKNSISAGFAVIDRFDNTRVSTLTAGYNLRIFERGNLQISAGRAIDGVAANFVGMTLSLPLDTNIITSAGLMRRSGQFSSYATATSNTLEDKTIGWRVLASQQADSQTQTNRAEAGLTYVSRYALLNGDASSSGGQTAIRLGASGGLLAADGRLFASQKLSDSFALVDVPGYPDLNISLGGRKLARTNANGVAIIPRLAPYQANAIRLDTNELPISAEIDNIEQTAVPASRSGVKLLFASRPGRAALLTLQFDDGEAAPVGATLHVGDESQEFYVARRGQAYLTGLLATNRITLKWQGQQCVLDVTLPPLVNDDIARMGPLVCKGVQR